MKTTEFRLRNIPVGQWYKFKAICRKESVHRGKDYWPNDALLDFIDQTVKASDTGKEAKP